MAYGSVLTDVVQSSTSGPVTFQNTSGTQIGTLCRAWVNYKGTATRAINASFNVSSVTFNGTGDYTLNFTTAMNDANYATVITQQRTTDGTTVTIPNISSATAPTSSAVRVGNDGSGATTTTADSALFCVAIFR